MPFTLLPSFPAVPNSSPTHELSVLYTPSLEDDFTCSGNANLVATESGITNAQYAVGASDANYAELYDSGDFMTLYLADELASGATLTVRWKKNSGTTNPTVTVQLSTNNSTWTTATGSPFTVSSTSLVNQSIVLNANTRYIRFTTTSSGDLALESATYSNTNCNYTGGGGTPLTCSATSTSITGSVFNDFNGNGTYESASDKLGISGVQVTAIDSLGNSFSATTSSVGAYSFAGLVANRTYRVEFSLPGSLSWLKPSFNGTDNGTTVQFLKPGNCADLGLNSPSDYCQDNPNLVVACYENGSGVGNLNPAFVSILNSASGISPAESVYAQTQDMGSVFGAAYDRVNKRIFVSSFLKRHSGFGPRGVDGVYIVDYSAASPNIVGGFDLQGVTPSNGGAAIDLGSINRTNITTTISAGSAGDYQLPSSRLNPSVDLDAFGKVATISYGDIDISEDGETLWMVNLHQKALISVDISTMTVSTANPNLLSSTLVKQYPLSSLTGLPTCTNGTLRPFALEQYKNKLYVGCVCDAASSSTIKKPSELDGYVISVDPTNPTAATTVVSFGFDHNREPAYEQLVPANGSLDGEWQRWMNTYNESETNSGYYSFRSAPQPVIADIEFKEDGSMILGIMDRFAHQQGWEQYRAISADRNLRDAVSAGDLLYFGLSGGTYTAELGETDSKSTPSGFLTNDGLNNTGEFFYGDFYTGWDASHHETTLGGLSLQKGTNEISVASFDPYAFNAQGITWMSLETGAQTRSYQIVGGTNIGNFGKGSALADLELLCNAAPVEIGNYVWADTDRDGIQDAGETGLNGVKVGLYKLVGGTATLVASTTTATVNGQAGAFYFRDYQQYGTGLDTLALNTVYYLALGETGGTYTWSTTNQNLTVGGVNYILSSQNSGEGSSPDINDNDAFVFSTAGKPYTNYPVDTVTINGAGYVNHSLDFGLKVCPTITNPSATQTLCLGATGSNITVNTSYNSASGIRFKKFTTNQSATNGSETATELANIYTTGTAIATVTPTGGSSPYTATYTFNAADFPTAGTYYIYAILNPDLGATCRPVQEIIINVNSVVASVVGSDQTLCSGGNPAAFTVSSAATGSGTLSYQWQSSTASCAAGFSNISLATSATYDPPSGLTQTTYYRVVVTSTLNSVACTATSNCVTVSVNNVSGGIMGSDQTICAGGNPAAFTISLAPTGGGVLSYQWQSSTTSCAAGFSNITLATSATYDPPSGLAQTTYYRVVVTSTLISVACTANSSCVTVTVNNVTGSTVGSDQTLCSGGNPAAFTVSTAATGSGALTYQWQSSTTDCTTGFSNISLATSATYDPPSGLTQTTYYRVVVTSTLNSVACTATSNCVTVAINSVTGGTVGSDQTICAGGNPTAFTVSMPATGSGTLSYQWQSSTTSCAAGFSNISLATSATYDPPSGLATTTYYRVVVTSTLSSVACTATSNCVTVTVNSVTASTVAGNQTFCSGGNPVAFTVSTAATGSGALSYQWQSSTTDCTTGFTNIASATSATYDAPSGLTQTTYYRVVVTSTLNSVACTANSNCLTVTINNVTASVVSGDQTVCSGGDPTAFTVTTPATGTGALTYQWQKSTTSCAAGFLNISGATSAAYNAPAGVPQTTYYRVVATSTLNAVACTATSNCITVTMIPFCQPYCTDNCVTNYSFENNTFPGSGTFSFAGGTAINLANGAPVGFSKATTTGDNYWVNSSKARTGSKYVYMYSSGTTPASSDACTQFSKTGLSGNTTYHICIFAADAKADGLGSGMSLEVQEIGGPFHWQNNLLPDNPAWSDVSATNIPWTQYCYTFTTAAATTGLMMWLSASAEQGGSTAYVVVDDVCVEPTVVSQVPSIGGSSITAATCTGGSANNNASISLTGITNGNKADKVVGASYTGGPIYGAGTNVTVSGGVANFTGLTPNTQYTFRVWNAVCDCYADLTLTTPTTCCVAASVVGSDQAVCTGGNPAAFTVSTGATGNGTLGYQWQSSTTNCTSGFANIGGATSTTYDPPTGFSQTTFYRVVVTNTINGATCTATSNCVTVTVNNVTASVIGSDQTICSGGDPAAFTVSSVATGSGTLSYQWQSSTTSCVAGFANIGSATSATYDAPSGLATTTYYRVVVTSTVGGVACTATSNCVTVTVNNVTASVIGSDQTICSGGDPAAFTVSSVATGSGTFSYQWQSSTTSCAAGFANIVSATSATYDPPSGLVTTTYYRVVVTSTLSGVACTATSNCVTVTVNNVTASTVGNSQAICSGGDPVAFTASIGATGSGTLSYQWQSSTTSCASGFSVISLATSANYDPPSGLAQTTYYRVVVTSTLNSVACTAISNCVTVTVNNVTASTVGNNQTICSGGDPSAFTVITPATGSGVLSYQWQSSTTSCASGFANIGSATTSTYDPPSGLATTTYYRVVVTSTLSSIPCTATSNCVTVAVNNLTASTVGSDQTICSGGDPTAFTVTTPATGSGTLTYQWQSSTTSCIAGFANIGSATTATYDAPNGLAATTYYRVVVTSTLSSVACTATSNCVTVTVNNLTASTVGSDQTICSGGNPAAFTVVTPATGGGTLSYQWQSSTTSCVAGFANIGSATTATYDPPSGLAATTYYRVVVTSTLSGVACTATSNCVTVTVNNVTASVIGSSQSICSGGNPAAFTVSSAATGSGTLSYQWQSSTTSCVAGFANIGSATSATYDAPSGLAITTYYRVVVTATLNGVGCTATSNCVAVTVSGYPNFSLGLATVCPGQAPEVTITGLTGGTAALSTTKVNSGGYNPYVESPPNLTITNGINLNATNTIAVRNEFGCETSKNIAVPDTIPLICPPVNLTKVPSGDD